jgi:hypothetical protein
MVRIWDRSLFSGVIGVGFTQFLEIEYGVVLQPMAAILAYNKDCFKI